MPEERSAGAILFSEKDGSVEYLLLHYPAGHWDFPKGNVEEGEKDLETVRREVKEETSIDRMKFVDGFRRKVEYNYKRGGRLVHKEVVFYLARTDVKDVKLSYEHKNYRWMKYEDALKRLTYRNSKIILDDANSFLKKGRKGSDSLDSYLKN